MRPFMNSLLIVEQKLKLPRANLRSSLQSSKKFPSPNGNFAVNGTLLGAKQTSISQARPREPQSAAEHRCFVHPRKRRLLTALPLQNCGKGDDRLGGWVGGRVVRGEPSAFSSTLHTAAGVPRGKKQASGGGGGGGGGGVEGVLSGTSIIRRSNLPTSAERKPGISLRNRYVQVSTYLRCDSNSTILLDQCCAIDETLTRRPHRCTLDHANVITFYLRMMAHELRFISFGLMDHQPVMLAYHLTILCSAKICNDKNRIDGDELHISLGRINELERRRHRQPVARRTPMKMLQSLNALAGKISPGSPTDSNANKVHMHNNNNNNNNNVVHHHHPYSKQQVQPSPSHSANGDQKENTAMMTLAQCNESASAGGSGVRGYPECHGGAARSQGAGSTAQDEGSRTPERLLHNDSSCISK
ncbi:hypothetical protein EAI_02858 [Harpegnathos saltator]|uniref:Uncharacterized protein n=1 Tax=Harpegnathos saltator TaxID=610380 RepID=E2C6S3_HARSA|nr:hypothetical protein EAI_02858 [Harpegnathos saltator]